MSNDRIKVFIDGGAGTTGLQIRERLSGRDEIEMVSLPEAFRKDVSARKDALNRADIAFLCLPTEAALEAAELAENPDTIIIDTSSAHRTHPDWVYGFPELRGQREAIRHSRRIANPGCHASGIIALVAPLVQNGVLSPETELSCFSLTGYSSNGKKVIGYYEAEQREPLLNGARLYGLEQQHKHLKEIKHICSLQKEPILCPVLNPYYSGIEVVVPLFADSVSIPFSGLCDLYQEYYGDGLVSFVDDRSEDRFLSSVALSGRDDMRLMIRGNEERFTLIARYDNLGKGACGAAIQNMNLLLGLDERTGLNVSAE